MTVKSSEVCQPPLLAESSIVVEIPGCEKMEHRGKFKGIVCHLNDEIGFGYITGELPSQFHEQNVFFLIQNVYRDPVKVGDAVEFSLDREIHDDLSAKSVWLLNENGIRNNTPNERPSCERTPADSFSKAKERIASDKQDHAIFKPPLPARPPTSSTGYQTGFRRPGLVPEDDDGSKCVLQTRHSGFLSGHMDYSESLNETPGTKDSSNTALGEKHMLAVETSRSDDFTISNTFSTMNLRNKNDDGSGDFTNSTSSVTARPHLLSPGLKSSAPEQISERLHRKHSISKTSTPSEGPDRDPSPKRPRKGRVVTLKDHYGFIRPFPNEMPPSFATKDVHFAKRAISSGDIKVNDEVQFQLDLRNEEKPSAKRVWSLKDINDNNQSDKDIIDETFSTVDTSIGGGSKRIKSVKESRLAKNKGDSISDMGDSTVDSQTQSNTQNRAAFVGFSMQQQIYGRIYSLKDAYGFIRPSDKLPEDYPQSKDVHFYLNKLSCGFMPLSTGDEVEFTLGTKDKDRPMAIKLQITRFRRRNVTEIRKYLESVGEQLEDLKLNKEGITDGMKMDGNTMTTSEFFVTLLTCLPAWNCVFSCTDLHDKDVQLLLTLILEMEEYCPLEGIFQKAIKVISNSKFFSVIRGRFKDFIASSVQRNDMNSIMVIQNFLLMLLRYCPEKIRAVAKLVKPLASKSNCFGCKFLHNLLKEAAKMSTGDIADMAWEELPLVPSTDELLFSPLEGGNLEPIKKVGCYASTEEYMDTYFRLLRADCFYALKKGIRKMMSGQLDPRDMHVYHHITLEGVHVSQVGVALCLKVTPQRKVLDWDHCSNLMFGNLLCISISGSFKDALWATVASRQLLKSHKAVMIELCSESNTMSDSEAIVMLENTNSSSLMVESPTYYRAYQPVLKALQKLNPDKFFFNDELVNVKSHGRSIFTDEENCFDSKVLYPGSDHTMAIDNFLYDHDLRNKSILDSSQEAALRQSLLHRVAIVQGPPGTGKTFLGVKLLQLLLSISPMPSLPILVVTYKNHALDEFLKAIISLYPDEIVRVGGRSQDPEVAKCNLNELKKQKMSETIFKEIQCLKEQAEILKKEVDDTYKVLSKANQFNLDCFLNNVTVDQVIELLLNCNWTKTKVKSFKLKAKKDEEGFTKVKMKKGKEVITKEEVEEIISDMKPLAVADSTSSLEIIKQYPELMQLVQAAFSQWLPAEDVFSKVYQQYRSNVGATLSARASNDTQKSSTATQDTDEKDAEDEQKERLAAAQGLQSGITKERLLNEIVFTENDKQSTDSPRLLSCAKAILSQSPIRVLMNTDNFWELSYEDRVMVTQFMMLKQFEDAGKNFQQAFKKFEDICSEKDELEDQHKIQIMANKKVVGMTITGASIHNKLLQHLHPAIVILEEAAEVQESQLLAALGDWTQYLIMIGDQKQLRPKVESYVLARDYHMDVSMMERLILNEFPYSTLEMQNRMMPEFAELLSDIYPNLQSNLKQVKKHTGADCILYPYFFWNHCDKETKGRSCTNEEEAERAIKLALFLIQQGYEPHQITILAAYQGQTALLRRKRNKAESDYPQLFDQLDTKNASKDNDLESRIQVHTIDMYQGDENDFVIVSLVRSNPDKNIGFLNSLNRRCVAQSRSRRGLYFIGNAEVLSSSIHWNILIRKLQEQNRVGTSIPINCPKHRESTVIRIKLAKDIKIGQHFCRQPCVLKMGCGIHHCRQACQPPHHHGKCRESVKFMFPTCGHEGQKECQEDQSKVNCCKILHIKFTHCQHVGQIMCSVKDKASCQEKCPRKFNRCGHPCHLKCGEVCRPDECKHCEQIREQKALARRKAEEEAIKAAKREAEKQIAELKKSGFQDVLRQDLYPKGDTASEYYDTADRVKKYIQPGHNWFPVITRIEKVTNSHLEVKWLERKSELFDPRRSELKFHGTSVEGVEGIIKMGFRMPRPGNHMYGAGIYFASDSSKSAQEIYTKGSGMLLLCDVLLGKSLTVESAQNNMTSAELKKRRYDSLYAKRDTKSTQGVLYDEFVVYNPYQAIPRYIIHFQTQKYKNVANVDSLQKKAVAARSVVKHIITPRREVDLNDPKDVHFRIAEAQFLRLIQRRGHTLRITSIDYWINPNLIAKFEREENKMQAKYGRGKESKAVLAFHGTQPYNVDQIMKDNFRLDKIQRTAYGYGIYFSEFPDVSIGYGSGLILCKILPGKSYCCDQGLQNNRIPPGYDSNIVRPHQDQQGMAEMVVIDNPDQILPCYVIHF